MSELGGPKGENPSDGRARRAATSMQRLVLVGAGHAHAQVLKDWIAAPLPNVELVLISPSALAPYSGMVPGWLAGRHRYEDICIDFAALAAAAQARLLIDELVALEAEPQRLKLRSGQVLQYDVLSLNVGSTLRPPPAPSGTRMLALRPLAGLRQAWEATLMETALANAERVQYVTAVGGGAAGVEALLAALFRMRQRQPHRAVRGQLVSTGATLLPGMAQGAARRAHAALKGAGVSVQLGASFDSTERHLGELLLWATGAEAHAWQRACGLAVSAAGFIRVDACLRSLSHPQVHAVGDCAEWADPLPKAGVYAVRMGAVLSVNLRAALGDGAPAVFQPQRRFLSLLSTADGRAIASWGRWSANGRWVSRLKDRIDHAFLERFAAAAARPALDSRRTHSPTHGDSQ